MPIDNSGVGYSDETRQKIIVVNEVADWQYGIVRGIWSQPRTHKPPFYYHIDAYCGTGLNPEDCKESASLQLVRRLLAEPFQSRIALIDRGRDRKDRTPSTESMRTLLTDDEQKRVSLYQGDNKSIIPSLLAPLERHQPLGLIFLDPNGVRDFPKIIPVITGLRSTSRMDILIHVGATAIKRARLCKALPNYQWYLDNFLEMAAKERGFIKQSPCQHGQGWFFILLTNAPKGTFRQWVQRGWHDLDTLIGKELRQIANYTEEERKTLEHQPAQSTLFD
jgi:hypothetical protein